MSVKIDKIHIENDRVNRIPTLIYTDNNGNEWVKDEHRGMILKEESWYFKDQRKKK